MIGTKLAHYEITRHLGSGGMGDVYQALDTKLGRSVAIKMLPETFTTDTERVARFEREARVLASLSHPNIAGIYGLEDSNAKKFLVMELVPGETLEERIARGAIPVEESGQIALQIAEALEAAHERGIVHRDLKPANIKITPDGKVKVLDFGLAKPYEQNTSSAVLTNSPTVASMAATQAGVILGTAGYMSPEQAAGRHADKRADIWSFGVVLSEMLTGKPLFAGGESISHVLADVLRAPIDFEKIPPGPMRELLRRCLDRDVKTRLRDIGEARVALIRALNGTEDSAQQARPGSKTSKLWPAIAAVALLASALSVWAPWRTQPEKPLVRLDVDLGAGASLIPEAWNQDVVISPDGSRLAFVGITTGSHIYIRRLDEDKPVELPGTDGAVSVAFSPDSKSLAFVVGNRVYRVSVEGGATRRLCETEIEGNSMAWSEDGSLLVSGLGAGLLRIPAIGGDPVKLTDLEKGESIHAQPFVLPGGKAVLFAAGTQLKNARIEVIPMSGGKRKVVVPEGTAPHYLPNGYLAYLNQGTLFAVRFNPDKLEASGDPVPIVTDVKMTFSGLASVGTFSFGNNGTAVYRKATGPVGTPGPVQGRQSTLEWIDPTSGKRSPLLTKVGAYYDPRVSPDGSLIALTTIDTPAPEIAAYDSRRATMTPLSFVGANVDPIWSRPDGRYLVFLNLSGGAYLGQLVWTRVGGGQPQPLINGAGRSLGSFTLDGKRLSYVARGSAKGRNSFQIFTLAVTEENGQLKAGMPELFSPPEFNESEPQFSVDGKWIAFVTDRSGHDDVAVRAFPRPASGTGNEALISNNGGSNPRWSANGRELFYREGDRIMSVTFKVNGDTFMADKPRVRVEKVGAVQWDLAPDGRIVAAVPVPAQPGASPPGEHNVVFLQNFFDEVKRKVK
jgi:serine/threonine-protein kinase